MSEIVGPVDMTQADWARAFLAVDLRQHVPDEIRGLYRVAQGCMLYGWFFYPLFRLGEEQLHRVAEAAVKARYVQLGGPQRDPTFKAATDYLVTRDVIPAADLDRWDAIRTLRNMASHPRTQVVMTPGPVLAMLKASAHDINRLFSRRARPVQPKSGDDVGRK
jgi:hypothetical protein